MKIGIVLSTLLGGGSEKLHIELANYFLSKGHKVDIIITNDEKNANSLHQIVPKNCKIVSFQSGKLRYAFSSLKKHFEGEEYDIVMIAQWPLTIISYAAIYFSKINTKVVFTEHTNLSLSRKEEIKVPLLFIRLTIFIFYRLADLVITVSKGIKYDLVKLGFLKDEIVKVIYNPVSKTGYKKTNYSQLELEELWSKDLHIKILSVGSLKTQKNFSNLIKAFSLLPSEILDQSQLIILGEGSERKSLEALVKDLRLQKQVFIPGFFIDPSPWFDTADLFVLSSSWEGFGNVIVEALQSGLTVVSTDCKSGPAEILDFGKYGILVKVDSPKNLAEGIEKGIKQKFNPADQFLRSQEFTVQIASEKYLDAFRELLEMSPK